MKNSDMPAMPTQCNGGDLYGGLTKREYFAGLAMQGLLANTSCHAHIVRDAIDCADALLEEIEK